MVWWINNLVKHRQGYIIIMSNKIYKKIKSNTTLYTQKDIK